jgi:Na+-translocating ferredoxin:NAD+ oxidoreductase subunit B
MATDAHEKLMARFNQFPIHYPRTKEGLEIKILKKLFSAEEAEIAANLPLLRVDPPESAQAIADSMHRNADEVEVILEKMAKKSIAYVKGKGGARSFALLPLDPGVLDFTARDMSAETGPIIAEIFAKGYTHEINEDLISEKGPISRMLPSTLTVDSHTPIEPYDDVAKALETSEHIVLMPCPCRVYHKAAGKECDHPLEVCMWLNDYADFLVEIGRGKKIDKEEALAVIRYAEEKGLVHLCVNSKKLDLLCSCCSCACKSFQNIINAIGVFGKDALVITNYELVVDQEVCMGCEICIDRCYTNALSMDNEKVSFDSNRCIACGACVPVCPTNALRIQPKATDATEPTLNDFTEVFSYKKRDR